MPENHLFEYAVIRIVPKVEREEFMNAGIIIFCKKENYLKTSFELNENRCKALYAEADVDEIRMHLTAFEKIANADPAGGPISLLDAASRFRWLTAKRSTVIQTSAVHPGFCTDMDENIKRLMHQLI